MNWLSLIFKLLPTVFQLAKVAEKAFDDIPESGPQKKELVMGATQAIILGAHSVSEGPQKETWEKIAAPISGIVDAACGFLFKK